MAGVIEVMARLSGNSSGMVAAFAESSRAAEGFSRTAENANRRVAASHATAMESAKKMGLVTTVALGAAAVVSVDMAAKFEKSTMLLQTAGGLTEEQMKKAQKGILEIASATGVSTEKLSEGMYTVSKYTKNSADGILILKAAAEGAVAEGVDMQTMVTALTSVMMTYDKKGRDAVAMQNAMIVAAGESKTTMQEFAGSLSTVLPIAQSAHLGFDQIAGAIATMTQHGTSAQEATQELRNAIQNLLAPNQVAINMMGQMGINAQQVSRDLGKKGLTGTIQDITDTILNRMGPSGKVLLGTFRESQLAGQSMSTMLGSMTGDLKTWSTQLMNGQISVKEYNKDIHTLDIHGSTMGQNFEILAKKQNGFSDALKSGSGASTTYVGALSKIMGGTTGMQTALMLSGSNMKFFEEATKRVGDAMKKTGEHIDTNAKTQETLAAQTARAKEQFEVLMIKLGTGLIPVFSKLLGGIMGVVTWFEKHEAVSETLGVALGVLGAALVIYTGYQWAANSALLAFPGTWVVVAIAALVGAFVTAYDKVGWFHDAVDKSFKQIRGFIEGAVGYVTGTVVPNFQKSIGLISGFFNDSVTNIQNWGKNTNGMFDDFDKNTKGMFNDFFKHTTGMFKDFFTNTTGMVSDFGKNTGGMFDDFNKNTKGMFKDFFKHVADGWSGFCKDPIGETKRFFQTIGGNIKKFDDDTTKSINTWVDDNVNAFKRWNKDTSKNLTTWIEDQKNGFKQWNKDTSKNLTDWISDQADGFQKWNKEASKNVTDWLNGLPGDMKRANSDASKDLHTNLDKQGQDFQQWNRDASKNVTKWLADAPGNFQHFSQDASRNLGKFNQDTVRGAQGWARDMKRNFETWRDSLTGDTRTLVDKVSRNWETMNRNTKGMFDDMGKHLRDWGSGVKGMFGDTVKNAGRLWEGLRSVVAAPIRYVVNDVYDAGLRPAWNNIANKVGLGGLQLPHAHFATGGIMSGYTPGRDDRLIAVGGGEAIMRPEWTRAVGPAQIHQWNAQAASGQPISGFASGGIVGDILGNIGNFLSHPATSIVNGLKPLVNGLLGAVGGGSLGKIMGAFPIKVVDGLASKADSMLASIMSAVTGGNNPGLGNPVSSAGAGVQQWAPLVMNALRMMHQPLGLLGTTLRRMNQESGGNPNAINNWDSNAAAGIPSKGLMQVIDPTFRAYAMPGYNSNIYDPMSNILASMSYAISRYGSLAGAYNQAGGYASGGIVPTFDNGGWVQPGLNLINNRTGAPEHLSNTTHGERPVNLIIPELGVTLRGFMSEVVNDHNATMTRSLRNSTGIPRGGH